MSHDDIRRLALALPEVVEQDHHGRPSFRVDGRILATLWDETHLNVMLDEPGIRTAVQSQPGGVCGVLVGQAAPCRAGGPHDRRRGAGARAVDRRLGAQGAEAAERREAVTRHGGAPWRGAGVEAESRRAGSRRSLATRPASCLAVARSTSQARCTSAGVVLACPTASRSTYTPRSTAWDRKISPPALTRRQQRARCARRARRGESRRRRSCAARTAPSPARTPPSARSGGQRHAAADVVLQARAPVAAQHRPQLQGAEAPPERGPVFAQRQGVLGVGSAQVLGGHAEGGPQRLGRASSTAASSPSG